MGLSLYEIDKAVREIIEKAHENARKVLTDHKDQVILVAERLLAKETITAEEIEFLCKNGYLPGDENEPKEVEVVDKAPEAETPSTADAPAESDKKDE